MRKKLTLEEFREHLEEKYVSKGVEPPKADSDAERVLYDAWCKGHDSLWGKQNES